MKTPKHLIGALVGTLITFSALDVSAQQISYTPRVSLGYQNYYYENTNNDGFEFSGGYPLIGLGLTAQSGRFFGDIYGQANITEARDIVGEEDNVNLGQFTEVDRYEFNLGLGYAITPRISASGGLKYAATIFDIEVVDNLADGTQDETAQYLGPYLGASAAFPVKQFGSVALTGSVAYLYGEVDNEVDIDILDDAGNVVAEIDQENVDKGASVGFNAGLSWIGSLSGTAPGLGYTVGLDYSFYEFEEDGDQLFEEEIIRIKGDIKYRF